MIRSRSGALLRGAVVLLLALGPLVSCLAVLHHNEQMYVAAGALAREGQVLYRDFAFLQAPYLPWLYAGLFTLTGGTHLLLAGKLLSWACLLWTAWLARGLARRARPAGALPAALVALVLFDTLLLRAAEEAANYLPPVALSLLAFGLMLDAVDAARPRSRRALGAGLALGASVGFKLYYLAALPPFVLAACLYPRGASARRRLARAAAPLLAGIALALLPGLIACLMAPEAALFDNWTYHHVNAQWRAAGGAAAEVALLGRLVEAKRHLMAGPTLLLLAVPVAVLVGVYWTRRRAGLRAAWPAPDLFLSLTLVATALAAAVAPRPVFAQYFAMPAGFALALLAAAGRRVGDPDRSLWRGLLVVMVAVAALANGPHMWLRLREGRVDLRVRADAARLRDELRAVGVTGPVATLSPLHALEAGLPIYPELATGAFLFRCGDRLSARQRANVRAASPATLDALLAARPPAAVFTGFEGDLDRPLETWAARSGYRRSSTDFGGGRLWVRAAAPLVPAGPRPASSSQAES